MKTVFLIAPLVFSLLFPTSLIDATEETGAYELNLCTGYRGAEVDENCNMIRPSPYAQQSDGVESEQVKCNFDMYRGYKTSDGKAFCATGYTLNHLINRGYAQTFDSVNAATVHGSDFTVSEYCPASQELIQWGWYGYDKNPEIINTNIDLIYDAEDDSKGVEFTFDSKTNVDWMIWVFVECKDNSELVALEEIKNHPLVGEFYAKYPDTTEEIRSDHVSYVVGSDEGFKVRMNLYFDENYDLDYINLKCYLDRELQSDIAGSFISKYLKDFTCNEHGSQRNES